MYASAMRSALVVVLASLAACLQSPLVPCDDQVCPPGNVCTAGGCATQADVDACVGLAEGDPCPAANGGAGTCQGGACQTGLCGNGALDINEVCDDANLTSGDGCRSDCSKLEVCGDAIVDEGEQCDDGNQNAADGCDACVRVEWRVSTAVGAPTGATGTALAYPGALAVDGAGRIYIADTENHRIRRVESDGSLTTIAGTGTPGAGGDGGTATSAQLNQPSGVAVDGIGRVFVADTGNHRIRMIDESGRITTIAGTGEPGFSGDGAAILVRLAAPHGVAVDGLGRLYIADTENHRIRRIDIDGGLVTVAGTGNAGAAGDGGPAIDAELASPLGVAVDMQGRVLVADTLNSRVRRVELDETIVTVAGSSFGFGGDGGQATAAMLASPTAVAVDPQGRIVIADLLNHRIRRVAVDGSIATVAGTGAQGYSGDGGPAASAMLALPLGVATDAQGAILVADRSNQRVRRIDAAGTIATVAGSGTFGFGGDGRAATSAVLSNPFAVAVDDLDRVYIADTGHSSVRRIELDGTITTIAGTGIAGFSGDGGPATSAQLDNPGGIAVWNGDVYIADTFNHRVRRVDATGTITTVAGTGLFGFSGDGGAATAARLANPNGLTVDSQGRLLVADTYNHRIRRVAGGIITTVAGTGTAGYGGDGGPATDAALSFPYNVGTGDGDRILISDTANHRIRAVVDGTISTIAGTSSSGVGADGIPATSSALHTPHQLTTDSQDRVVFIEARSYRVRRIESDGTISTLVGSPTEGDYGDAGPISAARLGSSNGVTIDSQDRIVIADTNSSRIRRTEAGVITTIAGRIDPEDIGPATIARLADPQALALTPTALLVAAGASGTLQAVRAGRVEAVAGRYPQSQATGSLARFRSTSFGTVGGVAFDPVTGLVYVTESSAHRLHVITRVDPDRPSTWTIATVANAAGMAGFADGAAATARFRSPSGLYLDSVSRTLYIADTGNHSIRALDLASSTVTTVVNTSHALGYAGDGGAAATALLYLPAAITRCANGDLFIADTGNHRVRRVAAGSQTISTVLGDGTKASSGEGAPAHTFPVDAPGGLACDDDGNLFVTSTTAVRLLPARDDGIVDGGGEVQTIYGAPPRTTFPSTVTRCLSGLVVPSETTVQVADRCTGLVVVLERVPSP